MRVVISRVKRASVSVNNKTIGIIDNGLLILSCFKEGDTIKDIEYIAKKCVNLRIFDDENGVMNKSVKDIFGGILSISQFTLYADTKKGNRPSYLKALNGEEAIKLYNSFNEELRKYDIKVETGKFGADMQISNVNDGPVTIIIDSEWRKMIKYLTR